MLLVAASFTPLYLYTDCLLFFEVLKIITFDFWGRRVGGDGDFFDFEWEPDRSLDRDKIDRNPKNLSGNSEIKNSSQNLNESQNWKNIFQETHGSQPNLMSDVSVSSLPLPLNIEAAFAEEDLLPDAVVVFCCPEVCFSFSFGDFVLFFSFSFLLFCSFWVNLVIEKLIESSTSDSLSVSIYFLLFAGALELPFDIVFAVADFLGTTCEMIK